MSGACGMISHMNQHNISVCPHGTKISGCRCMGSHQVLVRSECPDHCPQKGEPVEVYEVDVRRSYNEKVFVLATSRGDAESRARRNLEDEILYVSNGVAYGDVSREVRKQITAKVR